MRRSVDRRVERPSWLVVAGGAAFVVGLVIGAQDNSAGWIVAVVGGVVAIIAFITRD